MINFHIHDGTYLLRMGQCSKDQLPFQVREGEFLEEGFPNGCDFTCPHANAKWNIKLRQWVDCRAQEDIDADKNRLVSEQRYKSYPPLADLADALVHQAQGNNAPFEQYIDRCIAVKQLNPKVK